MSKKLFNPLMPALGMYEMGIVFGKGRPAAPVQTPTYTPPAAAPAPAPAPVAEAAAPATIVQPSGGVGSTAAGAIDDDGVTVEDEVARKKRAMKVGAKSLQIPTTAAGSTSTVGTGTPNGSSGTGR